MTAFALSATAFPDVKHLKNLKIEENREYLPPLVDAPTNKIESSTGYDYPKPSIPFPNEIETIYVPKKTLPKQPPPKLIGSSTNNQPVLTQQLKPKPPHNDYLPPVSITQKPSFARTGAETRIYSTTVKPFQNDYLPPFRDGAETRINENVIPSPSPKPVKLPTNEYLPPTRRPTTARPTPAPTTTTTTTRRPIPPSYAPAANTPIPSVVSPGPYYTKFDEENGYDYSKPSIGFDLPNNMVPVLNSVNEDEDEENNYASASAPTNNVPVYTSSTSTTTTTEDTPPAPDVIYTPSHTLDDDGYRYKVPNTPFNF